MVEKTARTRTGVGIGCLVLMVAMAGSVLTGSPAASAPTFTITDLGTLGGASSQATALNNSGQVAGWSTRADGTVHAFSWTSGDGMVDLGTLGGATSNAAGVNNHGMVVGYAQTAGGMSHAFAWTRTGGMVDLGTFGGSSSFATAVNDDGLVVGRATTPGNSGLHAFAWKPGDAALTDLGTLGGDYSAATAVSGNGSVVGWAATATGFLHAFSWSAGGGMVDLAADHGFSIAQAVNGAGQVVGFMTSPDFSQSHAFSSAAGTGLTDLGTLGGANSSGVAVNDAGQVAGWANPPDGSMHAMTWTAAGGLVDLGTLGGSYSAAVGINGAGRVVGYAATASEQHAFAWTRTGGMVDLGTLGGSTSLATAVNVAGRVAGAASTAEGSMHATLWVAPTPYERFKEVVDGLPAAPRPFADAKARLGEALDLSLWNADGTDLSYRNGTQFFDRLKQGVERLDKANTTDSTKAIGDLWAIADELAGQAVNQAVSAPGARANEVRNAQRQLAGARQRWAVDRFDAFERLKQAWRSAGAAVQ